jgi:hypothetical protein
MGAPRVLAMNVRSSARNARRPASEITTRRDLPCGVVQRYSHARPAAAYANVPTKKRNHKHQRRALAKRRAAPARPRIIDLNDYSSAGRPTKYVPEFGRVAETMAAAGATDVEIAQACGVAVRTLYRWKAEIAGFRDAIAAAKQLPVVRVERSLYHRAVGYKHDHDVILSSGGEVIVVRTMKHYPPDTAAARLWLNNVDPLHWRPRPDPEASKTNTPTTNVEDLTDEEIDAKLARIEANRGAKKEQPARS